MAGDHVPLYDLAGNAVAYIVAGTEGSIHLWSGEAAAYLHGEHVYSYDGRHLGWFEDGALWDQNNEMIGVTRERLGGSPFMAPMKGMREVRPMKAMREMAPMKSARGGRSRADLRRWLGGK